MTYEEAIDKINQKIRGLDEYSDEMKYEMMHEYMIMKRDIRMYWDVIGINKSTDEIESDVFEARTYEYRCLKNILNRIK